MQVYVALTDWGKFYNGETVTSYKEVNNPENYKKINIAFNEIVSENGNEVVIIKRY